VLIETASEAIAGAAAHTDPRRGNEYVRDKSGDVASVVMAYGAECGDLVLIGRVGENPAGSDRLSPGVLFCAALKRDAAWNGALWLPALVVLLVPGGDCGPGEN
jgi:hypothetical protein